MVDQVEQLEDGTLVIRNEEQVQVIGILDELRDAVHSAKDEAYRDGQENESLHTSFRNVDWTELECTRTERWLDSRGDVGWRCYIGGPDRNNKKLLMVLRGKLLEGGWDNVEVVPE